MRDTHTAVIRPRQPASTPRERPDRALVAVQDDIAVPEPPLLAVRQDAGHAATHERATGARRKVRLEADHTQGTPRVKLVLLRRRERRNRRDAVHAGARNKLTRRVEHQIQDRRRVEAEPLLQVSLERDNVHHARLHAQRHMRATHGHRTDRVAHRHVAHTRLHVLFMERWLMRIGRHRTQGIFVARSIIDSHAPPQGMGDSEPCGVASTPNVGDRAAEPICVYITTKLLGV